MIRSFALRGNARKNTIAPYALYIFLVLNYP